MLETSLVALDTDTVLCLPARTSTVSVRGVLDEVYRNTLIRIRITAEGSELHYLWRALRYHIRSDRPSLVTCAISRTWEGEYHTDVVGYGGQLPYVRPWSPFGKLREKYVLMRLIILTHISQKTRYNESRARPIQYLSQEILQGIRDYINRVPLVIPFGIQLPVDTDEPWPYQAALYPEVIHIYRRSTFLEGYLL